MAKPKKIQSLSNPPPPDAEMPRIKWKVVVQILIGLAVLWFTAFMTEPYIGYWGIGVVAAITLAGAGLGIYVWRLSRKSKDLVSLLASAQDADGRKEALAKLNAAKGGDAMNALAQAQLLAQEDPKAALEVLEKVDLKKAQAVIQDDIRANRALFYLMFGRLQDARMMADDIHVERSPNTKARGMYAAIVAETFARTGKGSEAKELLETFKHNDPEHADARLLLKRALVYTQHATKNRSQARKTMKSLADEQPEILASFLAKGVSPQLQRTARELLQRHAPRPSQRMRMR